jgi:glycosyltransferase involved in cell wall biosynthesis
MTLNTNSNPRAWDGICELSVVVPVYNAEGHASELLSKLEAALFGVEHFEIILVDDCSRDGTIGAIKTSTARSPRVKLISLRRNVGQATATAIGLANAKYKFAVTLDDDLQHDPTEIPGLLQKLEDSNLDFVVAKLSHPQHSAPRRLSSSLIKYIARSSLKTPTNFEFSSFNAFRTSFLKEIDLLSYPELELGWMFRMSSKYANHPVSHREGIRGASTYRLTSLLRASRPFIRHFMTLFIKPLIAVGLLTALVATVLAAVYLVRFAGGTSIPGFATLTILALTNIAISSLFLAVIIQWLARIRQLHLSRVVTAVDARDPFGVR